MSTTDCTTKRSYTHLTAGQRGKIQAWLSDGHSMAEIARRIGVHRSSISREIKRGSVQQVKKVNGKLVYFQDYFDETAQNLAEKRREAVYCLKLEKVSESFLTAFTEAMLAKPRIHSVDTFIHAYKQDNPDELVPSTKTMYTYIHQGLLAVKPIDLPRAMRLKPKVKKRTSTKKHLGTSIEERLEEINNRSEFGHWEIDSVLGLKTAGEPSILTLVERKTRYAITVYLAGKKAEYVNEAVSQLLKEYPIKSITAESLATTTSAINQRPRRLLGYQSAKTLLGIAQAA
ncbi:IS30 family transposase [Streptococcus pneumoniae]